MGVRRIQVGLLGRRQRVVLLLLPSVTCEKEPGHCGFLLVQARPFRDGEETVCGAGLDLSKLLFLFCFYSDG